MNLFRCIICFSISIILFSTASAQQKNTETTAKPKVTETKAAEKETKTPAVAAKKEPAKKEATPEEKETIRKQKEAEREAKLKESDIKKAEWIEKTIKYGINQERKQAVDYIPTVKDSSKKSLLEKMLIELIAKESDVGVMVRALSVAGELKISAAADNIALQINNTSEDVRIGAVYALKDIGAVQKKDLLSEKLKTSDFTVDSNFTTALIETLAEFKAVELFPFVKEKFSNNTTTKSYRLSLLIFLGKIKSPESYDFLLEIFKDANEDIDIRGYAVNSISKLERKDAAPAISEVIREIETYPFEKKKRFYPLYMYSVTSLVKLGDSSAYDKLEDSLRSDNTGVRIQAIKLLKELKDNRAIDILKYKAEFDPSTKVQSEAISALKELGIDYKKVLDEKTGKDTKDRTDKTKDNSKENPSDEK